MLNPSSARAEHGCPAAHVPNRVIKLERTGSGRRSVYVPLARRAGRFLAALAESGNVSLACEIAGIGKDRIYRHRRENEGFAAGWEAAKAAFRLRAEEQGDGIDLAALERDGLTIRRGRGGQVQIVSAHPLAWTSKREEAFFAAYVECGNVAAAARAAGFSAKAVWERARTCHAFRARLEEAKKEATGRLGFHLIEHGTNLLAPTDGKAPDPQLAMWLLKREDQKRDGTLRRGAAWRRPRSLDEVRESILKKFSAIERHRAAARAEAGWTQTGDGHWIPPGWVKG